MKYLTTAQVAAIEGVSTRRIQNKLKTEKKRYYPGAKYLLCSCGRKAWFIPRNEVSRRKHV